MTCSNWSSFCVLAFLTAPQASTVHLHRSLLICACSIQQIIAFCISDLESSPALQMAGSRGFLVFSFHPGGYLCAGPFHSPTPTFKVIPVLCSYCFSFESQHPRDCPLKYAKLSQSVCFIHLRILPLCLLFPP